jgi:hypothetical protein
VDVVALRSFTIAGRSYVRGDRLSTEGFGPGKADQLISQRIVEPATAEKTLPLVAAREFSMGAIRVRRGETVDGALLGAAKRSQLLEQRYLVPSLA